MAANRNAYNRNQLKWEVEQVAALTLFSAFYDDVLQINDLSYPGQVALIWAENHIEDLNVHPSVAKQGLRLRQINNSDD